MGAGSPEAGVTGGPALPRGLLETKLQSSARAASTLNQCAISPALCQIIFIKATRKLRQCLLPNFSAYHLIGPRNIGLSPLPDSLWFHFLCRGMVGGEVIASASGPSLGITLCEPAPSFSWG